MLAGWYILTICWWLHVHFKQVFLEADLGTSGPGFVAIRGVHTVPGFCDAIPHGATQGIAIWLRFLNINTSGIRSCFHWQEQSNKHYNSGRAGFVKDPANDDKNTYFKFIIFPSLEVLFS